MAAALRPTRARSSWSPKAALPVGAISKEAGTAIAQGSGASDWTPACARRCVEQRARTWPIAGFAAHADGRDGRLAVRPAAAPRSSEPSRTMKRSGRGDLDELSFAGDER